MLNNNSKGPYMCNRLDKTATDMMHCKVQSMYESACRAVSSRRLVPGDVVVLLPGTATCDMALLQGNCLVEESSLSGEVMAMLYYGHHHYPRYILFTQNSVPIEYAQSYLAACMQAHWKLK